MTRPRGKPPTPSAMSRPTLPVGIVPISAMSPPDSGMIAPLPSCFSIAAMAPATAFNFSFMLDMGRSLVWSGRWLIENAVLEGFGQVGRRYRGMAGEVGDRPRHAAHAGDGARGQAQAPGRPFPPPVPGPVERRAPPQLGRRQARVPARAA